MSRTQNLRHKLHMVSRGPGGPFERADYEWVRECRKAGWSLKVIASYFEPQPSATILRRVLREKIAPHRPRVYLLRALWCAIRGHVTVEADIVAPRHCGRCWVVGG